MYTKSETALLRALCASDIAPRPHTQNLAVEKVCANYLWRNRKVIAERCGKQWAYARMRKFAARINAAITENGGAA
jgi:hypothetical protein